MNKSELEHGAYYSGRCRNADEARWDADKERFVYWRTKWGTTFLEEICHPDDDQVYDVFTPDYRLKNPVRDIPFVGYPYRTQAKLSPS